MDDYIARQPIMNGKAQVRGYHLFVGQSIRALNDEEAGRPQEALISESSLFSSIINELSDHTLAFIDYFEELGRPNETSPSERSRNESTAIVFGRNTGADEKVCAVLKSKGYKLALDSTFFSDSSPASKLADMIVVEFTSVNLSIQAALIRKYKNQLSLLARKIDTWSDYKVAKDMGYNLFQGFFFLWPTDSIVQKEIKSLDVWLIGILSELEKPEPNFKTISEMIEHDLGLSYKLLRLVNSAYMAPKYRIKSITQALTYLGTRELHQWISMLMFNGIRNEENSELVTMSLIRGKLMALVVQELQIEHKYSEPFFTGLFSLIDVILNKDMTTLLAGLPLSDDIKTALLHGGNMLSDLVSFVISYEQAQWQKIEDKYPMNTISPQRMVTLYIDAHKWSKLLDHPSYRG